MRPFELILFSVDATFIRRAVAAGVSAVIVDWEAEGKELRQLGADTEINRQSVDDLRRVRAATATTVLCRVNAFSPGTAGEIEDAVAAGVDEILLPMVRTADEVEAALALIDSRCRLGILVETRAALDAADALARLPLSRVYVGLNDLAIERRTPAIFAPLVDGTLDALRPVFGVPFGFGGLTLPDRGSPIPCRLLIGELARLRCSFSFLRRSFHRDIAGRDLAVEIPILRSAIEAALARPADAVARDRAELVDAVQEHRAGRLPSVA